MKREGEDNQRQLKPIQQYNNYLSLFGLMEQNIKQESIESSMEDCSQDEQENTYSISNKEANKNEDQQLEQNIKWFLDKSKQNTFKNIINAFQRHIHQLKDKDIQNAYEKLTQDKWVYSYISLRVYQNLKRCGRFSLKVKNLLTSPNLRNIFLFFLKNAEEFWIKKSKIKEKEQLLSAIEIILSAYEHDCEFLVNNICYYRKQKKLSSD